MFGIPIRLKVVPLYDDDDDNDHDEIRRLWDSYGYTTPSGVRGIKANEIKKVVESDLTS